MSLITFAFDATLCSGCFACVVACQDQNDLEGGTSYRQVVSREAGDPVVLTAWSLACAHCGDAPCRLVCPTGAIFRCEETGIIDVDHDRCIGCQSCLLACPFGAPRFPAGYRMAKCDLCYVRVTNDRQPACVKTCTTGALSLTSPDELSRHKAEQAAHLMLRSVSSTLPSQP
jgi:anaerobic dimethyl sulfoxide reductase subunit B